MLVLLRFLNVGLVVLEERNAFLRRLESFVFNDVLRFRVNLRGFLFNNLGGRLGLGGLESRDELLNEHIVELLSHLCNLLIIILPVASKFEF